MVPAGAHPSASWSGAAAAGAPAASATVAAPPARAGRATVATQATLPPPAPPSTGARVRAGADPASVVSVRWAGVRGATVAPPRAPARHTTATLALPPAAATAPGRPRAAAGCAMLRA